MKFFIIAGLAVFFLLAGIAKASDRRIVELNINLDPAVHDRNKSVITINSQSEYDIELNKNISIPIAIYRGSTLKRTVYIWIEDNEERISSKQKISLPTRFKSYDISANLSFSKCFPDADYNIVAEGLGLNTTKSVNLRFPDCTTNPLTTDGKLSYSVLHAEKQAESGKPFKTRILISNPTDQHLEIDAWSYIYRSSRCYSGDREQNKKTINVPEFSNITFDLENTVDADPGDYNLKIKLLRSDRKTPKEITFPLSVVGNNTQDNNDVNNTKLSITKNFDSDANITDPKKAEKRSLFASNRTDNSSQPGTVYESSSARARKIAVYILILLLALLLVALILKRL
ncbi:hypothetical protein KY349_04140 [Candidatus Woesearchaeota archaeon]|jgi:hypothetical protein|nr:hypothetical protein [Candidatus Woesearchaeota archaeon]